MSRYLGVVLLAAAIGGEARAQNAPATEPQSVAELVKDLKSPQFLVREAAMKALMRLPAEARSDVENALAHATDAETIVRLQRVAVHLLLKPQTSFEGKIGLMGVRLSTELTQLDPTSSTARCCVLIWKTQPGFPVAEVLQVGDRIIGANGTLFPLNIETPDFQREFQQMINSAGGGAVIPLTVLRNGKMFETTVRLAGIRPEDANSLAQLVDSRDKAAQEYLQSLKVGNAAQAVVVHDTLPPRAINDMIIPNER